jgi:hypothetical protein
MMHDYDMFSEEGNAGVQRVVDTAIAFKWTWAQTYAALEDLAKFDDNLYGEALDTAVREAVYCKLKFKNEPFYI